MEGMVKEMGKPSPGRHGVQAERSKSRKEAKEPCGKELRAPVVAKKRVTTAEQRGAGR